MGAKTRIYRNIALFSHLGLLVWLAIWYSLFSNTDYSLIFILLIYFVPLLLPLYGVIKAKPYTHAWTCFVVLWYFLHAITIMYAEPSQLIYASVELVLACSMFVGCAMFARLRGQELGTKLPKLSKVMQQERELFEGSHEK